MTLESLISIGITALSLALAPILYIWRGVMQRLDNLEHQMKDRITEDEVRQLLLDKLDPIKDDVHSLDKKLDTLIDHLINKR